MVVWAFHESGPFHVNCQIYECRLIFSITFLAYDVYRICNHIPFFIPSLGNLRIRFFPVLLEACHFYWFFSKHHLFFSHLFYLLFTFHFINFCSFYLLYPSFFLLWVYLAFLSLGSWCRILIIDLRLLLF